jgi:hypothetical protein
MADQATSAAGRSPIVPHPETPTAGAPASGNTPADGAAAASADSQVSSAQQAGSDAQQVLSEREAAGDSSPGFGARGRMRRRLRFLRKARELGYRDLGGLVFEMQRLGERRDELVAAKLATLAAIDTELRALEDALAERRPLTILRESGIAACPRCAAIHGSEDRFCPSCGLAMESRADRPIAAVATPAASAAGTGFPSTPAPTTQVPLSFAAPTPAPGGVPTAPVPAAPATAVHPPLTPQAPPQSSQPPQPSQPSQPSQPWTRTGASEPVTDERPTEIIRPPDESPREET